ncbi:outer membrane beta-barrel protein, partial [Crocinitomix catalasitica]|nr:outer membrane beta-barrel protein [Crocinitomix catalasitica]
INGDLTVITSNGRVTFNESNLEKDDEEEEFMVDPEGNIFVNFSNEQRFTFLHIPLSLELSFQRTKFRYYLDGGVSFNFLIVNNVDIDFEGIGSIENVSFGSLDKVNLQAMAGFGLAYQFNKRWSVGLSSKARFSFQALNAKNEISTFPYSFGVGINVRHNF